MKKPWLSTQSDYPYYLVCILVLFCFERNERPTMLLWMPGCHALSSSSTPTPPQPPPPPSRRDLLVKTVPLAGAVAFVYGRGFYNVYQNLGLKHPEDHERRVRSTLTRALKEAAVTATNNNNDTRTRTTANEDISNMAPFRILEVGMGTDCRIARRGLYAEGLQQVIQGFDDDENKNRPRRIVELVGVDVQRPDDKTLEAARQVLRRDITTTSNSSSSDDDGIGDAMGNNMNFRFLQHSITETPLPFPDGFFDTVICCLTLCSVDDPVVAVREMHRLIRPAGGTLGYVEHVAAQESRYRFLERQQLLLDPWQQRVADNCHLHRYTEDTIRQQFSPSSVLLQQERFVVDSMWPVSMQACGVYQKQS